MPIIHFCSGCGPIRIREDVRQSLRRCTDKINMIKDKITEIEFVQNLYKNPIDLSGGDHENIKKLLFIKKANHYVVEESKIIKAVIKGLPASTDVTDIESELKAKGVDAEKVAQLRRFSTKAPLPLFMIEIKRSDGAEKIYDLKNLNYLTVEVVSYRKKPGTSQCFNCNYFNRTTKNCRMAPRCLKCGQNHRT
ncbi:nucleic-acid-binding protein from transposon X-element [Trichonephila clavipes]|uniref:Nucleic-acid-binding protein from transposon X-element n=1 Tax=Trichonephila clavipes TaxID=2585209 RepID=A0A8X6R310_TRICX|nr:nucleic-acid-binding protein from transposon X-element [Trichonephila clavipes]